MAPETRDLLVTSAQHLLLTAIAFVIWYVTYRSRK